MVQGQHCRLGRRDLQADTPALPGQLLPAKSGTRAGDPRRAAGKIPQHRLAKELRRDIPGAVFQRTARQLQCLVDHGVADRLQEGGAKADQRLAAQQEQQDHASQIAGHPGGAPLAGAWLAVQADSYQRQAGKGEQGTKAPGKLDLLQYR